MLSESHIPFAQSSSKAINLPFVMQSILNHIIHFLFPQSRFVENILCFFEVPLLCTLLQSNTMLYILLLTLSHHWELFQVDSFVPLPCLRSFVF